jgi:hypothetical protein
MARHCGNHARVNPLIEKVLEFAREAQSLGTAYNLVQYINQTGQLKRYRRDRLIALAEDQNPVSRQRGQIDRDRENMRWLSDSAEEVISMTTRAIDQIRGVSHGIAKADLVAKVTGEAGPKASARVVAVIPANTSISGLLGPRDLAEPLADGRGALWWTVTRILKAKELDLVVLATAEVEATARLLGELAKHPRVRIESFDQDPMANRRASVAIGRRWSRSCWRGGIGNLTAFDEAFAPAATSFILDKHKADAAVVVGADWSLVDPSAIDGIVTRYRAAGGETGTHQMVIVHAAPGLGGCLIERDPVEHLVRGGAAAGPFSSIGALIGYLPFAPQMDLIGKPAAMVPLVAARNLSMRCIADSGWARRVMGDLLAREGADVPLATVVQAFERAGQLVAPSAVTIDLGNESKRISVETVRRVLATLGEAAAVTLSCGDHEADDPTGHPDFSRIVAEAKAGGAMVHVVSTLKPGAAELIRDAGVEVVSVPLVTKAGELDEQAGMAAASFADTVTVGPEGLPNSWVVARLTRRDALYGKLEELYDAWLMRTGACVIDPLAEAIPGERITPLPVPASVVARRDREELVVGPDGSARTPSGRVVPLGGVIEIKSGQAAAAEAA